MSIRNIFQMYTRTKTGAVGLAGHTICPRDLWGLQTQPLCHSEAKRRKPAHKGTESHTTGIWLLRSEPADLLLLKSLSVTAGASSMQIISPSPSGCAQPQSAGEGNFIFGCVLHLSQSTDKVLARHSPEMLLFPSDPKATLIKHNS